MQIRAAVVGVVLCSTGTAHAAGLDISLADETAHLQYLTDSGSLGYGGADVGVGVFFNEDDDVLGTGNLLVTSNPSRRNNLQFGIGAKGYGGEFDRTDETVGAVAIGGVLRYIIPAETPMAVALEGYAAPSITSFSDTDDLKEVMTRFEVEVMPSTRGYIGYRFLEPDLDKAGEVELDDNFHVGIRITF